MNDKGLKSPGSDKFAYQIDFQYMSVICIRLSRFEDFLTSFLLDPKSTEDGEINLMGVNVINPRTSGSCK